MDNAKKSYDLEERTYIFAANIIKLCKNLPKNVVTIPLISQLIRAGTSVGANYREANGASSKPDFKHKIFICKKEAKETQYWLNLLKECCEGFEKEFELLISESQELILIFSKIAANTQK